MIEELKDIKQDIANKSLAMICMAKVVLISLPDDFIIKFNTRNDLTKEDIENHFTECIRLINEDLHRINNVVKELKSKGE